jgi:DNA-binding NarL/FixJ family response regulator
MTGIIIADDHPVVRQGLVSALQNRGTLTVLAEASDGEKALHLIAQYRPQIAVLDVSMPCLNGFEVLRQSLERGDRTEFVMLTMFNDEGTFNEAMDLGVKGYVLKESALEDIVQCLETVAGGGYFVSPRASGLLVKYHARRREAQREEPAVRELTVTERRILRMIGENRTSREIGGTLFVSHRTVQKHRTNICEKLGLQGYNRLLQYAIENKHAL